MSKRQTDRLTDRPTRPMPWKPCTDSHRTTKNKEGERDREQIIYMHIYQNGAKWKWRFILFKVVVTCVKCFSSGFSSPRETRRTALRFLSFYFLLLLTLCVVLLSLKFTKRRLSAFRKFYLIFECNSSPDCLFILIQVKFALSTCTFCLFKI